MREDPTTWFQLHVLGVTSTKPGSAHPLNEPKEIRWASADFSSELVTLR